MTARKGHIKPQYYKLQCHTMPHKAIQCHSMRQRSHSAIKNTIMCQERTSFCLKGIFFTVFICIADSRSFNVSVIFYWRFCFYKLRVKSTEWQNLFCSIWNIFCSFQNDSLPIITSTTTTTKLLLGPLSFARGQKNFMCVIKKKRCEPFLPPILLQKSALKPNFATNYHLKLKVVDFF